MGRYDEFDCNAHTRTRPTRIAFTTLATATNDSLPDDLYAALEIIDRQDREKFPDLFEKVDAIKVGERDPRQIVRLDYQGRLTECTWCGDPMPVPNSNPFRPYCSVECSREMRRFETKRRRAG